MPIKQAHDLSQGQINNLRKEAKSLRKRLALPQIRALNTIAIENGFKSWNEIAELETRLQRSNAPAPITQPSEDTISEIGPDALIDSRTADLPVEVKDRIAGNRAVLAREGIDYSILELTTTGLKKSILDATGAVRNHFGANDFHNYEAQGKGPEYKVLKQGYFVTEKSMVPTRVSLYRPKTKNGDPRIWFSGLPDFAEPGDQIALILLGELFVIHLSGRSLQDSIAQDNQLGRFLTKHDAGKSKRASELLERLRAIAATPLKAVTHGDTAVGMSVEAALGIPANSSKLPDYFGIEIKSGRDRKVRSNLFAQVADWAVSALKSSKEILDKYGYDRGEAGFKLYCTVSTQRENSQGLSFNYNDRSDRLVETDSDGNEVAVWPGSLLRRRLIEKHSETFWIRAEAITIEGVEHFLLKSVIHTRTPLVNQLIPLIESGVVTMDHLIKRSTSGRLGEKGPLFKIDKKNLGLLFPAPVEYPLT